MRQGLLRSSRYSPGNMDRDSLEALFVGRQDVMEDVLFRVASSTESPDKHYILLVGPRGSGKTHFLALAYHRIMDRLKATHLEERVAVALLNEEEWGVASYLDLLVRILRALAERTPGLREEIAKIYERFARDPANAETFAASLLREHTQDKTLLLLCENLVDLFDGLDDEGQKRWRAAIQESGNWCIVATTPALFSAITLQNNPFYGFFAIRELKQIDFETGLELLVKKAKHEGKTGLAGFLTSPVGRARVRAVHHLAAGNHRAYVVLFDFLDKESLDDLIGPFMRMVDDLTPYYQDRMRQLPPAQRKIVEFLCLESGPRTVKEISNSCLMSQQTAAKQIGQLAFARFVSRMPSGRNTYCELSEPLMRICIEVKDNRTRHFRLFVEFLRHWFSNQELENRVAILDHDSDDLDRVHVEEAVNCFLADRRQPFLEALHVEADLCWNAGDHQGLAAVQGALVRDGGSGDDYRLWVYALVEAGDSQSAIAAVQKYGKNYPDDDAHHQFTVAQAYWMERRWDEALSEVDRALDLDPDNRAMYLCFRADVLLKLDRFEGAIKAAEAVLTMEPEHWHSLLQIIPALAALGRPQDAEARATELVRLAPDNPRALVAASSFYYSQDRLDDALKLVDMALDTDPNDLQAHRLRGHVLFDLADYRSASDAFREVISRAPSSVSSHCRLSDALVSIGNYEEAIDIANRLIELEPDHYHAYLVHAEALIKLGRNADAVSVLDRLLETEDHRTLLLAATEARQIGDYESAKRYLDRVAELQPNDLGLWSERTRLQIADGDFDSAAASAAKIQTLSPRKLPALLLTLQPKAAQEPLHVAFEPLYSLDIDEAPVDEEAFVDAISAVLTVSMCSFGPRYLQSGIMRLRDFLDNMLDERMLGTIIGDFLFENLKGFPGPLEDWEQCLHSLDTSLADLEDCQIPLGMLGAAVRYAKTGDDKHLLRLPLEQRQLLKDVLPESAS